MLGRLAVVVVVATVGCQRQSTQAPASTSVYADVPAHYMALAWFARAQAPLFAMLKKIPGGALPCVDDIIAQTDGYAQAEPLAGESSLIVFHGAYERANVEGCVRSTLAMLALGNAHVTASGAITEIATPDGAEYLGWAADGNVVANRLRSAVEEALAGTTNIAANAAVAAMAARVDRTRPQWTAGALDYTTSLLGVPSLGFFLAPALDAAPPRAEVTVAFRTADDARRAADAVPAAAHDPRFSPELQQQLALLAPAVTGTDVVVDAAPLFARPELYAEVVRVLSARTAATCDELRPMLVERERGEIEYLDWTKVAAPATKAAGVTAAVDAIVAACTQGSWPRELLQCLATDPNQCEKWSAEGAQFSAAEGRAFVRVFGPPPRK